MLKSISKKKHAVLDSFLLLNQVPLTKFDKAPKIKIFYETM